MLFVIGFNHHRCPIDLRERVCIDDETFYSHLNALKALLGCESLVMLNTCNRSEFVFDGNGITDLKPLLNWIATHSHLCPHVLNEHVYYHEKLDAIKHILHVCCGLDSMLVGEQQIFGQFKRAIAKARELGHMHNGLFLSCQKIFQACKYIRHTTQISQSTGSLGYAIRKFSQQHFKSSSSLNHLFIGTGETIDLVVNSMNEYRNQGRWMIASRTIERAKTISQSYQLEPIRIQDIPSVLSDIDVVVSATSSQCPLIGKGLVETVMKSRQNKAMLFFDLAVPRDIEAEIEQVANCELYNIDMLQSFLQHDANNHLNASIKAKKMIDDEAETIYAAITTQEDLSHLVSFREHILALKDEQIDQALKALTLGEKPNHIIQKHLTQLTHRFLHMPTVKLKDAIQTNRKDIIDASKYLFENDEVL